MANERVSALGTQISVSDPTDFSDRDSNSLGSRKITPFDSAGQFRNNLAPVGALIFDGTNSVYAHVLLTGQAMGTDAFAISCWATFDPTASNAGTLWGIGPVADNMPSNGRSMSISWDNSNSRWILTLLGATNSDYTKWAWTTGSLYDWTKPHHFIVVKPASGNPAMYVNGVSLGAGAAAGTAGTVPTWQDTVTTTYLNLGSINSNNLLTKGILSRVGLYNLELSAANVREIFELGGQTPQQFRFGSQVAIPLSDFSVDTNGFTVSGGTLLANQDGIGGENDWLKVTSTATNNVYARKTTAIPQPAPGQAIRVTGKVFIPSTNPTANANFSIRCSPNTQLYSTVPTPDTVTSFDSGIVSTPQPPASAFEVFFRIGDGTGVQVGDVEYLKNLVVKFLGAVGYWPLDDGFTYLFKDQSANKLHGVMTVPPGITHLIPQNRPHHVRGTTNTNGNQQMWGQVLIPANSQVLRVRARAQTNTPTITIGSASGGSQIVASIALSTTWKDLTIALTGGIISADTSIWIGSNSTDVVEIDITCEPLSP